LPTAVKITDVPTSTDDAFEAIVIEEIGSELELLSPEPSSLLHDVMKSVVKRVKASKIFFHN